MSVKVLLDMSLLSAVVGTPCFAETFPGEPLVRLNHFDKICHPALILPASLMQTL